MPPTHTHTHTHTHTPGAVDTHTHTPWSSGQSTLRRPGSSWGFGALLKGLTSVVDNSCRSREPTTSDYKSSALSIRPRLPLDYNLQLYCKLLHIQCGSVKSNAILIKIHKHINSYSFASKIPSNVRFFSEIWMNEIPCFLIILHIYFLRSQYSQRVLLCASTVTM